VIAATVSEAPYVLDGLMHHVHQTDLRIREHYTEGRRDRARVRPLLPARVPVRAAYQRSEGPQALHDREARHVSAAGAADRRDNRSRRDHQPVARAHACQGLDRGRCGAAVGDAAQACRDRSQQCPVPRPADARPDRAYAVHAPMAVRPRLAPAQPCGAEQGRSQQFAAPRGVLPSPGRDPRPHV